MAELERIVNAYATINRAAATQAEALAAKIQEQYLKTGNAPTRAQIMRMRQYRELMETVDNELIRYQGFLGVELSSAARLSISDGERDARILMNVAAGEAGINAVFRLLNPDVIETLLGFLDPRGPLYKRIGELGGWTAEQVSNAILEGIGLGKNPRTIARWLTQTIGDKLGMGLTNAMRMMRTVQLWSYREANRASFAANSDVVRGWVWHANLDGLTCASCVAMHGTVHRLDETLNDHHNGRCAALPLVIGANNPIEQSGEQWFNAQSEAKQREILGPAKYDAWKKGKITLASLSGERDDEVYGPMRGERSLKELLGG